MSDHSIAVPAKSSATDLELTLSQIKGVFASSVVLDSGKDIGEIHVVSSSTRKPKQIVRDIETLLFVKHRLKIDYRKISLVQLPDAKLMRIPMARPEIREVKEDVVGDEKRIQVEIQGASRIAQGQASERLDHPSPYRTAARATVHAIERLLSNTIDVRLDEAETFSLGPRQVLIVILTSIIENREETFVGASFVGARPIESAARATLDALNRRIYNLDIQAPRQDEMEG